MYPLLVFDIDNTLTSNKQTARRILNHLRIQHIPYVYNTFRLGVWKMVGMKMFQARRNQVFSRSHISKKKSKLYNLQRISRKYGVPPAHIYLFDDSCEIMSYIRKFGFKTVCVDRNIGIQRHHINNVLQNY